MRIYFFLLAQKGKTACRSCTYVWAWEICSICFSLLLLWHRATYAKRNGHLPKRTNADYLYARTQPVIWRCAETAHDAWSQSGSRLFCGCGMGLCWCQLLHLQLGFDAQFLDYNHLKNRMLLFHFQIERVHRRRHRHQHLHNQDTAADSHRRADGARREALQRGRHPLRQIALLCEQGSHKVRMHGWMWERGIWCTEMLGRRKWFVCWNHFKNSI